VHAAGSAEEPGMTGEAFAVVGMIARSSALANLERIFGGAEIECLQVKEEGR